MEYFYLDKADYLLQFLLDNEIITYFQLNFLPISLAVNLDYLLKETFVDDICLITILPAFEMRYLTPINSSDDYYLSMVSWFWDREDDLNYSLLLKLRIKLFKSGG